jgi:hypothetical protein
MNWGERKRVGSTKSNERKQEESPEPLGSGLPSSTVPLLRIRRGGPATGDSPTMGRCLTYNCW